jgi:hypothetical protein
MNARTCAFITPRSLGLLCFLFFLIWICEYFSTKSLLAMVLSVSSMALLLLAQRMVTQIIVIVTPLLVLFCWVIVGVDLLPVLYVVGGGFLLAFLLTGGKYKLVIKDHVIRLLLHARHGDQTHYRKTLVQCLISFAPYFGNLSF